MFSGNVFYRGDPEAVEVVLNEATQLANFAVAKKAAAGVYNFREQFVLSTGATLDVVINEHQQFIIIYALGEEPEEEEPKEEEEFPTEYNALYVVRPKPGYPKVVIYEDSEAPDGVSMELADNIYAGPVYTQYSPNPNKLLISIDRIWHVRYFKSPVWFLRSYGTDSPNSGNACRRTCYIRGRKLLTALDNIIGAAIVTVKDEPEMYCFVTSAVNSYTVRVYSHPAVTIPDEPTNPTDALIDRADLTQIASKFMGVFDTVVTTDFKEITTCTFDESGTNGVFMQTGKNSGDNHTSQITYSLALDITDGVMTASITSSDADKYVTGNSTAYGPTQYPVDANSSYSNFCNLDSQGATRCTRLGRILPLRVFPGDLSSDVIAETTPAPLKFGLSMNTDGTLVSGNHYHDWDSISFRCSVAQYSGIGQGTIIDYSSPVLATSYDQAIAAGNADNEGAETTGTLVNITNSLRKARFTFGMGTITRNARDLDYNINVKQRWFKYTWYPDVTPIKIYPTGPLEGYQVNDPSSGRTSAERAAVLNGNTCTYNLGYDTPASVGLRENMGVATHHVLERTNSFYWDSDTNTYPYLTAPLAPYNVKKCHVTFHSNGVSYKVPGVVDYSSGYTTSSVSALADPQDPDTTAMNTTSSTNSYQYSIGNYAPFEQPAIDAPFLPHPKGYCLYSMSDYFCEYVINEGSWKNSPNQSVPAVLGLFIQETGTFVDILAMYNDLIANDDQLTLAPVSNVVSCTGTVQEWSSAYDYGTFHVGVGNLMDYAGVLDEIHTPTIDYSDY